MLKKVYICSPLGGNVAVNLEKAKLYAKYALKRGTAPVVPHFYALCLDDNDPRERELGITAGLSLLWFCDELWVFGNDISQGMQSEIRFCNNLNIPIKYIDTDKILNKLGDVNDEK